MAWQGKAPFSNQSKKKKEEEEKKRRFEVLEENVILLPACSKGCVLREPRGFGFVQYLDPADAADAQFRMDRQTIAGREITVVFAEDNRKKPSEMRVMERSRGGGGFRSDKYRRGTGRGIRSSSRSRSPPARRHSSRERLAGAREKRSKHGASSPHANGQGAAKSSLSPRPARSSASNSESLE